MDFMTVCTKSDIDKWKKRQEIFSQAELEISIAEKDLSLWKEQSMEVSPAKTSNKTPNSMATPISIATPHSITNRTPIGYVDAQQPSQEPSELNRYVNREETLDREIEELKRQLELQKASEKAERNQFKSQVESYQNILKYLHSELSKSKIFNDKSISRINEHNKTLQSKIQSKKQTNRSSQPNIRAKRKPKLHTGPITANLKKLKVENKRLRKAAVTSLNSQQAEFERGVRELAIDFKEQCQEYLNEKNDIAADMENLKEREFELLEKLESVKNNIN